MTVSNIAVHRLHSQQLEHAWLQNPGDVVRYLGAVQAQDYAGAKWSIGLRSPGGTDAGVERGIADNVFVRTWALRGTLHFVAAQDVRWLLALVAPRIIARNTRRYSELDERTLARSNAVLADTLRGGERLDRRSLVAILEENGISTRGQRAAYMLHAKSLSSGGGVLGPTIVADGRVVGTWKRKVEKHMVVIEASPFARLSEACNRALNAARRYGRFLNMPFSLATKPANPERADRSTR